MKKKTAAIVLAAGKGSRMQSETKKQFLDLKGKPVVYYSLKAFEDAGIDEIILVTAKENMAYCRDEIIEKYIKKPIKMVSGGAERYHSVYAGLKAIKDAEIVYIHDGARPFIDQKIILDSYETVKKHGTCVVGMPVKDTIKIVNEENICVETPNRNTLWQIQTPQTFFYHDIFQAYEKALEKNDNNITDDAMVMERYGEKKIKIILGKYENIKITTPEDMKIAEIFLKENQTTYWLEKEF